MTMLVTLQEAKNHLRIDTDDDAADLTMKVQAASAAVLRYIDAEQTFLDSAGEPLADSDGAAIAPFELKAATLLLVGSLYRDREGDNQASWSEGNLPLTVRSLLYPYRTPTTA